MVDSYSHEPIDKSVYQIYKHSRSPGYIQVLSTLSRCSSIFKGIEVETEQVGHLSSKEKYTTNLWTSNWKIEFEMLVAREINGRASDSTPTTPVKKVQLFSNPEASTEKKSENGHSHS